jgi:thioredoxin 1
MSGYVNHRVEDATFEVEVLQADGPVLLCFVADSDGSSARLYHTLEEIAEEYGERVEVAMVPADQDHTQVTCARHMSQIRGTSSVVLYKSGKFTAARSNISNKADITAVIDAHI